MEFLEILKAYGVGPRRYDDSIFSDDKPPPRFGIYDVDEEVLCHEVIKSSCQVPGCTFTADSLLDFENHYNTLHRYACSQCRKMMPSPHLLDLHIQETHDSYFALLSLKRPSYACYIEVCKEKFMNADERLDHCVKIHKIPKDYRFDQVYGTQKGKQAKNKKSAKNRAKNENAMDVEPQIEGGKTKKFAFTNSKQKAFAKYTGKKFTDETKNQNVEVNIDDAMEDLKESLPN